MIKYRFISIIFYIFLVFLGIYNLYLNKNLKIKIERIEIKLKNQEQYEKVLKSLQFLNSFAEDYKLISSEAKIFPSGEEYLFIYKFESKESFEKFLNEKSKLEIFKIWKSSLENNKIRKVIFVDKDNNILDQIKIGASIKKNKYG